MRLRMLTAALVVLVAATCALGATIPLQGEQPRLDLQTASKAGLTYRVEVGKLEAVEVQTKGGTFTRLSIPGFHTTMIEGAPELPQMNRLIAVPFGAEARVQVRDLQTRTVRLADLGLTSPVIPHQPSLSKSQDPAQVPFVHDLAAYQQSRIEHELVRVQYQGRLRAVDFARLEIAPVRYLPRSGELEIVESFDLTVTYNGGDLLESENLAAATASPFFAPVYAKIDGSEALSSRADLVTYPVKMVIITPPEFEAQLQEFVDWKTERGFEVITGVIGSPEVGTTASSIQAYLHDLYDAGTPEDPAPSFVIFIGDVAQCPTFTLSGDASDRPYCAVDGDLFPEMYYGRLSATNSSQLQAILDKTMLYDTYSMPDPSYLENVTLIAGVDSYWAPTHANGTIRYGEDYYFNAAHDINASSYYYPESGGAASQIINDCNTGIGFINYTAHGSQTSWSNPSMTQSDINGMTNDGKYFLAIGNCCLTSTYDYGECFGETFLRAPNRGAIGYIGGSNSTYWHEDVYWSVGALPEGDIRDGMTYEETGLGSYDGLFHDMPNEINDPSRWYVTNDAIIFCGNLAVTESGSSRIEYYWNIYNLLGDPSIATYVGAPQVNPVDYVETVFVGSPTMTVHADQGTYVGLTQAGTLVGAGYVDDSGSVDIEFNQILTPGVPLKLVAMAQNRIPVVDELNVIVPAVVTLDPTVIDANVETQITVTVMEEDGTTPKPGIDVWAEGLQYQTVPVATDAAGVAVITVDYPYGPTLDIVGQDPGESYRLFTEQVAVNATPLAADLVVTTDIGLVDAFPLNLPGYLSTDLDGVAYTLYAELPDGSIVTGGDPLMVTATELGQVTGIVAVDGHDLVTEAFDVIEAYGTVAGTVTSEGSPLAGVVVNLLDDQGDPVFSVTTGADGTYAGPEEVLVDDYTLMIDHFGYLHYEQAVFVNYGANTFDAELIAAPAGVLTGHVYDSDTMEPLQATVKVYRTDDGSLYEEVTCDENGLYTTGPLPYFTYEVKVRAWHHVPVTAEVTIDSPELIKDWVLDPTNGDLLLIDDTAGEPAAAKFSEKGELLAEGYVPDGPKSVSALSADLEELGYFVSVVSADAVDPATFWDYDMVMLVCGDNTSTLQNGALKTALVQFAQDGGHILLEGGELGYDQAGSGDFATYVMHSNDWNHDSSGNVAFGDTDHYVASQPNSLVGSEIAITYSGYGDSDAMVPLADAVDVAQWTSYPSDASVIAYDPNPSPVGGQIVFFCFNYAAAGEGRVDLLQNAVQWLLTPEFGTSTVQGTVLLAGMDDHSGITVRAVPGGGQVTTGADGTYSLEGLYAGTYQIVASKEGWSTAVETVTLVDDQVLAGVDMVLTPTEVSEYCDTPGAPIQDNQTTTVTMEIPAGDDAVISAVEVYLDITHTFIGDLIVTLSSPCQTTVVLHNRSGGSTDDIVGWYPDQISPDGDLESFIGLNMAGEWTLEVSDNAGGDVGTINEWCLRITHDTVVSTEVPDDPSPQVPVVFKAYDNYPNPFNPMTNIKFDLPRATHVSLRVYDLAGRLVRELVNEPLQAASHVVRWDGTDNGGRRQASGVYYYRLVTDERVVTKKMTLVK